MGFVLEIEPGDAVEHGLPPARITADLSGVPMMPFEYPAPDTYVTLSGPPGGPLFFYILALPRRISTPAALQEFVQERFGEAPAFILGPAAALAIGATTYASQLFFSGRASAASVSCAVAIPAPAERASVPGLLLVFGHGATINSNPPHSAENIARFEPLALILARLTWDLCIDPNDRKHSNKAVSDNANNEAAPDRSEDTDGDVVEITPEDAASSGLPPVHILANISGLEVIPDVLGGPEEYLFLAGPAESALFFTVLTLPHSIGSEAEFLELVRKYHGDDSTFKFGEEGTVSLRGADYPAVIYFGEQNGVAVACVAVLIPSPEDVESPGLLLLLGDRGTPGTKLADLRQKPPFSQILDRLVWDFTAGAEEFENTDNGDHAEDAETNASECGAVPAPPQQAPKPAQLARWVGNMSDALRSSGMWMENPPPENAYGTMTPLQQRLWTLQAALQALEPALQQAQERQPDEPLFGIVETVRTFSSIVPDEAELAKLRNLIDHGP